MSVCLGIGCNVSLPGKLGVEVLVSLYLMCWPLDFQFVLTGCVGVGGIGVRYLVC